MRCRNFVFFYLQAIKALKDTIEECWDHDAEARISAVCAEERTREMAALWEMRFKGLTPTTALKDLEDRAVVQRNLTYSSPMVDSLAGNEDRSTGCRNSIIVINYQF